MIDSPSSVTTSPYRQHHHRIAFGSCNNQNLTNPLWDVLKKRQPTAFVWAGDAIYADIHLGNDWSTFPPHPIMSPATPQRLRHFYNIQMNDPSYRNFLSETNVTVFGTIDDHDMGMNNGDESYEFTTESGLEFLRFTGEDISSPVYKRAMKGYGVYGVKVFDFDDDDDERVLGSGGGKYLVPDAVAAIDPDISGYNTTNNSDASSDKKYKDRRVAIFFLDVRTNRTPWGKGFGAWTPNYDGDFLGERQWQWFEAAIRKSDASVNVIVNGLQVHSYRHPNANLAELWVHLPTSRQRLYDAILQDGVKAPILVSGDVHMAQLMRKDCWASDEKKEDVADDVGQGGGTMPPTRPLVEFTTSGMTHSWGTVYASSQKFHKYWWMYYPMHAMSVTLMTVAHWLVPMPDLLVSSPSESQRHHHQQQQQQHMYTSTLFENGGAEGANQGKQFSMDQNFGEMEFDFMNKKVYVRAFGKEMDAHPLLSASYSFDQLSGIQPMPGAIDNITSFAHSHSGNMINDGYVVPSGRNICVNHHGPPNGLHLAFSFIVWHCVLIMFIVGPQLCLLRLVLKLVRRRMSF